MSGLIFVGGIVTGNLWLDDGKKNSRNFRQGNRVYDSEGIATALSANSVGGLGGETSLYKVEENKRNEDETLTNTQTSIFEFIREEETVEKKPFKYISLFAGIGGFDFGLNAVGGECVFASEIDKFAKQAYTTLHGLEPHGDITKIDAKDIPDHDVIAAGFPCQSFSVAGKRGGFEDARGTLFFEVARIASVKQPKVLLLENVKGLVGHDKGKTLDTIVKTLNEIGYRVDFEVLNSKYFGVPQNRERIFIVAIREDLVANEPWNIEGNNVVAKGKKRISGYDDVKTFNFDFPKNETVTKRLVDVLEDAVDEKYYLDENKTNQLIYNIKETDSDIKVVSNVSRTGYNSHNIHDPEGISPTIAARDYKGAKRVVEGLPIKEATKKGFAVAYEGDAVNISFPSSNTRRGRVGKDGQAQTLEASGVNQGVVLPAIGASRGRNIDNPSDRTPGNDVEQRLEINSEGTSNTLTSVQKDNYVVEPPLRIKESFNKGEDTGLIIKEVSTSDLYAIDDILIPVENSHLAGHNLENAYVYTNPTMYHVDGDLYIVINEEASQGEWVKEFGEGFKTVRMATQDELLEIMNPKSVAKECFGRFGEQAVKALNTSEAKYGDSVNAYNMKIDSSGLSPTLTTRPEGFKTAILPITETLRIRKLTPLECWRLQGFTDEQHNAVEASGISNSQRYKQAGNAVTVNVIEAIGTRLLPYL